MFFKNIHTKSTLMATYLPLGVAGLQKIVSGSLAVPKSHSTFNSP